MKFFNFMKDFLTKDTVKKNTVLSFIVFFSIMIFFAYAPEVFAQQQGGLDLGLQYGAQTGLPDEDIRVIIARIIRVGLGILGIIAVGIILYGGAIWMTSNGDQGKVDTARNILKNGVIGLAIILSAFSITQFVLYSLIGATQNIPFNNQAGNNTQIQAFGGGGLGGGALGRSIRDHYPMRGATDIPRNAKIVITFAEKIKKDTILLAAQQDATQGKLNFDNIKIYETKDAVKGGAPPSQSNLITEAEVFTKDQLTFVIVPKNLIGSASGNVDYTVFIDNDVQKVDGSSVFSSLTGSYAWEFTTSTVVDTTPPTVQSVTPTDSSSCPGDIMTCAPRNHLLQVNFSESIDPTMILEVTPGTNAIEMTQSDINDPGKPMPPVNGTYVLTNQYKTVTFIPSSGCNGVDENSCGDPVYCLPGNSRMFIRLKTATIDTNLGAPSARLPYDGIVDLAGNSLDGNANGVAQGPIDDHYLWTFHVSNTIDLTPPEVVKITPDVNNSNINPKAPVEIQFNKEMLASSLYGNVSLNYMLVSPNAKPVEWAGASVVDFGVDSTSGQPKIDSKKVVWKHFDAFPEADKSKKQNRYDFYPIITSGLQDITQNCYYPATAPAPKCQRDGQDTRWKNNPQNQAFGAYPSCDLSQ